MIVTNNLPLGRALVDSSSCNTSTSTERSLMSDITASLESAEIFQMKKRNKITKNLPSDNISVANISWLNISLGTFTISDTSTSFVSTKSKYF